MRGRRNLEVKRKNHFYGDCSEKLDGFDNTCKNGLDFLISRQKKKKLVSSAPGDGASDVAVA